jgi:mannosyl-oligosaccharide alpha-1,2-mannosidase
MFRLRRYRFYVAFAALTLIFLYRTTRNSEWEGFSSTIDFKPLPKTKLESGLLHDALENLDITRKRPKGSSPQREQDEDAPTIKIPVLKPTAVDDKQVNYNLPTSIPLRKPTTTLLDDYAPEPPKPSQVPSISIPDRKTPDREWAQQKEAAGNEKPLAVGLGRDGGGDTTLKSAPTPTVIHWTKPTEHFPVAPDSIIPLPAGKPKSIPKVQHAFKEESEEARGKREERLGKVKAEMTRAWTGYKTYAWMHDELSPVSKRYRDPFCGWAATLVDALDTLWIMGMKDEFDEAVKAIATIDFTTTLRPEIPIFETTIRYLGGFLGAYDVSGGHKGEYKVLLDKAVELAEILMGVFDTPNRMPVLYYNWKPTNTKYPKRSAAGVSIAELGSLAMEFTRLAQLTKEDKYYDVVARITDALHEWQNRPGGTAIPGIFPERVDASGCNGTAAANAQLKLSQQAIDKVQSVLDIAEDYTGREYSQKTPAYQKLDTMPGTEIGGNEVEAGMEKGMHLEKKIKGLRRRTITDEEDDLHDRPLTAKKETALGPNIPVKPMGSWAPDLYQRMRIEEMTPEPHIITGLVPETCYPMNLASGGWGADAFGMGGSQDSTYEYFPKQFLLLGGLEPKYQDMHLKVAKAVKDWLLYRPMVPDNRDILFSAKVSTRGKPETDLTTEFEVTHLTCFLGGMFGMAGKIFEDAIDVEIGKKLTDGCVWAYESMPTGIMPEGATVVPCAEVNNCQWNETLWWQYLDPMWAMRDAQIQEYDKMKEENKRREAEKAELKKQREEELKARREALKAKEEEDSKVNADVASIQKDGAEPPYENQPLKKRDFEMIAEEKVETSSNDNLPPTKTAKTSVMADSVNGLPRMGMPAQPGPGQVSLTSDKDDIIFPDPARPLSHKEYVANRIKNENIQPGYVNINYKRYILR